MPARTPAAATTARRDLAAIAGLSLLAFWLLARFEAFEWFVEFSRHHESYQLDELILIPGVLSLATIAYAVRRWIELRREVIRRVSAERAIAQLNASLEQQVAERTTELRDALDAASAVHRQYALVLTGSHDGIWDWSPSTDEIIFSDRWGQMLGYPPGALDWDLTDWLANVHPAERDVLANALDAQRQQGDTLSIEYRVLHTDGSYRWMQMRSAASVDASGAVERIAGAQRDITENKAFDPLTGLANRVLFDERLDSAMTALRSSPDEPFAVIFIDADRFKAINDTFGHEVGDQVLLVIAKRANAAVREFQATCLTPAGHTVARLGGDEFAILVEGIDPPERINDLAQRLIDTIAQPISAGERQFTVTVSVGCAVANATYDEPTEILRDADTAMYAAKTGGRGIARLFDPDMRRSALERVEIESALPGAAERGEFFLEYQPKLQLATKRVRGFEALVRWNHPTAGVLAPDSFIPLAEETGAIHALGAYVLRAACEQIAEWRRDSQLARELSVSVNVAAAQLEDLELATRVAECLESAGVPPAALDLEITETAFVGGSQQVMDNFQKLRDLGVGLKIDDFGSGYASLDYLCRFPFDAMKIDREFIRRLEHDNDREVVGTMISLAHRLGLRVIAEGIETDKQRLMLEDLGCECGQGYLFARPLGAAAAADFLRTSEEAQAENSQQGSSQPLETQPT